MKTNLSMRIRQALLMVTCGASVSLGAFAAAVGPQNPPPGPNQIPDYFGVVGNYAYSPAPNMAQVTIQDSTGTGASAAATTYDYTNWVNTKTVMDVQIIHGGSGYTNPTVTVSGGPGSTPITLTPIVVNGVITEFQEFIDPTSATNVSYHTEGFPANWPGVQGGSNQTFTAPIAGTGIRKFVDSLSTLNTPNNLGSQLPVAIPDTATFPGSDYYEIAIVQYNHQFHSDLPATTVRGYKQINAPAGAAALNPDYFGPIIHATSGRPVRIKLVNQLPTGAAGKFPFPVDHSYMGSAGATDTDNRSSLHFHGGNTPWISDGTPRQWIKPAGEAGPNRGASAVNVPDMWFNASGQVIPAGNCGATVNAAGGTLSCNQSGATTDPGAGALTFYFTNQQSQRLMFYHEHAEGVTRLGVYGGISAGYILSDSTEQAMTNGGTDSFGTTYQAVLPVDQIPIVIQEKTFVPDNSIPVLNYFGPFASQLNAQDPTWKWGSGNTVPTSGNTGNGNGDLWVPHVYMTNQGPGDVSGANALGRWDYGDWFWPPYVGTQYTALPNPYYDPSCVSSATTVCEAPQIPGVPNGSTQNTASNGSTQLSEPTATTEAFNDMTMVNGTVHPFINVEPKKYRLRILTVGNDRTWNLSMVVAASKNSVDTSAMGNQGGVSPGTNSIMCDGSDSTINQADCTEVKMVPFSATQNAYAPFPSWWYTALKTGTTFDDRTGGVYDPATRGPAMVQIGTDGGFLSSPAVIPNGIANFDYNNKSATWGNLKEHSLLLGPAERADVVVDFANFAGATVILYNDAPAAIPGFDLRNDHYTKNPDNTDTGGTFSTLPGYAPNTRTLLQFRVASTCTSANCGTGINRTPAANAKHSQDDVDSAYLTGKLTPAIQTAFKISQDPVVVPQNGYNQVYGTNVGNTMGGNVSQLTNTQLTFTPILNQSASPATLEPAAITMAMQPKSIIEYFTADYGRMDALLGIEVPKTTATTQTGIEQEYIDPPTEIVKMTPNDGSPISGVLADGTQLWKISHNGVDTHSVHFHLFNVQIVNRVAWDGTVLLPDANEMGWKDVVRMNPLTDTIVALRPKKMVNLPFKVPNSHRLLDPSNAGPLFMMNLDPTTGNGSNVTNTSGINFGWEYIWHCHILGHEENDMMRNIIVAQIPDDPSNLTQTVNADNSISLNWTDNSMIANWITIQRDTVNTFNSPNLTTLNAVITECASQTGCPQTYQDKTAAAGQFYYYRLQSNNTVGAGDTYRKLPAAVQSLTPNFTGYDNETSNSNWSNSANPLLPTATLSATSESFGNQLLNTTSAAQSFTLSNTGTGALTIQSITTSSGVNFAETNNCPAVLAPGANCSVSVTFKPTTLGALSDTITITDNTGGVAGSTQTVSLTGTGVVPVASVSPSSLSFGNVNYGSTSAVQNVVVTNTGSANLTVSGVAVTGTNYSTTNGCTSVAPNATCTIGVSFKPTTAGSLPSTLSITDNSNAVANSVQTVSLTGTGVAAPIATVSPGSYAFPATAVGSTSAANTITLRNTGDAALTISAITVPAQFARPAGAAGGTCATTLAANTTCTVNVTFKPTAVGSYNSNLVITDNSGNTAGSTQVVALTGSTPAAGTLAGTGAFGNVQVGTTSASNALTFTNTGPQTTLAANAVSITGTNAAQFAVVSNTCNSATLATNATCTINVDFAPTSTGLKNATNLQVAIPNGTAATLALSGTGATPSDTVSNVTSFGTVTRGTTSPAKTVTVTNNGTVPLQMAAIPATITGTNSTEFQITGGTCTANSVVAVGSTCTILVDFAPLVTVATGPKTAVLTVSSNATAKTVNLTGTSR